MVKPKPHTRFEKVAGRPKLWPDKMTAPLPSGSLARMGAVLRDGETRTDFVRQAVERELERREKVSSKPSNSIRRRVP